jgi:hypothetical protein
LYAAAVFVLAASLMLAGAGEFVLFGLGDELIAQVRLALGIGAVATAGAVAMYRRRAIAALLLLLGAAMLVLAPRLVERHRELIRAWARGQAAQYRAHLLGQSERLPCANGDIAVIEVETRDGRENRNLVVVPRNPSARPDFLAQSNPPEGGARPSLRSVEGYIASHGDCGSVRYPSLLDAVRVLQQDYDRLHPDIEPRVRRP